MAEENATSENQAGTITLPQAATLLMVTERRVQQLVSDGYIDRPTKAGRYSLVSCVHGRIKSLQDERKAASVSEAENRVRDARAREIEMRNARADHSIIDTSEALSALDEIVGMVRSGFAGLPARVTRDLEVRAELEKSIDATLNKIADRLAKTSVALRTSGENAEDEDESPG